MQDGAIRRVVKAFVRLVVGVDLRVRRRLGPAPRYRLAGTCEGCGKCCETPAVRVSWLTLAVFPLLAMVTWWHRVVNGFELTGTEPRLSLLVFRCTHYDPVTKRCDSYESRPTMCRDYPVNLTFEAVPSLFDECTHRVVDRNAAKLRVALERSGLSAEKRDEVEKKLFLKE